MKKYLFSVASLMLAMPLMFGGASDNGAFVNDYGNHYVNTQNPDVRFDWDNQRMAVPGQGGAHADENSAVMAWGDGTLVDPQQTL